MSWITDLQHTVRERLDSGRIAGAFIDIEPWVNRDPFDLSETYIALELAAMEQEFAGK